MRKGLPVLILAVFLSGITVLYDISFQRKENLRAVEIPRLTIPPEVSGISSLDFMGLAADFQLLQAIFFVGEKIGAGEAITEVGWSRFDKMIEAVTDLDPFFHDAYYFAGALYTWETRQFEKAITLLEKGMTYRTWDYRIPFRIGFTYFYFLKDNRKGGEYIARAARIPGAPDYYGKLASRLTYYGGDTRGALLLLKVLLEENRQNPTIRKFYEKRIQALERILYLENAVRAYTGRFGSQPKKLSDLVEARILPEIPDDPYGGTFYLKDSGSVYTTSELVEKKPIPAK